MLIKNCMLIDGADIFEEMKDIRIVTGRIKEWRTASCRRETRRSSTPKALW